MARDMHRNSPKLGPGDSSDTPSDRPGQPGTDSDAEEARLGTTDELLAKERRERLPKEPHTWVSPVKTSKP